MDGTGVHVQEGTFAVLVALGVAFAVTATAWTFTCSTQYVCINDGTCRELAGYACSFQNVVSPAGLRAFNLSADESALAILTRGVCSAGERQNLDAYGRLACVRAPAFPSAFNAEAASPAAASYHERACGRWIDSRDAPAVQNFAFFDEPTVTEDVTREIRLETTGVAMDDVSRFRTACERMILNSAAAPAADAAFTYLKAQLGTETASESQALQQIGVLVSHYCDAPIGLGTGLTSGGFVPEAVNGVLLSADAATEALYAFAEPSSVRQAAREFADAMRAVPRAALSTPTAAQLDAVIVGAVGTSWIADSIDIHGGAAVVSSESLNTLARFVYVLGETTPHDARAYLLAHAAQCSFATRSMITGEFGANVALREHSDALRTRRPRAVGLNRIEEPREHLVRVGAEDVLYASTATWSHLRGSSALDRAGPTEASGACWRAAAIAFGDDLDERVLAKLTTPHLIDDLLPPIVTVMKAAVQAEIQSGRMAPLISDPAERARLATAASSVQFKIAGAARGSTFGRAGTFERPTLASTDGALLILLKQGRQVFLDRLALALEHHDVCELPPLFPSTSRNAYLLTAAPCSMILAGLLVPPIASDRYDEASLYERIGWVAAHEAAHVASDTALWDLDFAATVLANYSAPAWAEAAADLTAADAVLATGRTTAAGLCSAVSQLWCARVPDGTVFGGVHPPPNLRGDNVCSWLQRG